MFIKRHLPEELQKAKALLLLKPGKQHDNPATHQAKYWKAERLQQILQSSTGLSDKQFGFRRRRSTLGAIDKVMITATEATSGARRRKGSTAQMLT